MFKRPIKQIYLLLIVIVGIISLSVYSTYALFTYEKETGEVVKISTLDYLQVNANSKEYKRVLVAGNSLVTVDIDINNPSDRLLCYGIWYHVLGDVDGVYVYKANSDAITSGSLEELESRRVTIIIFNDNKEAVYVNIGINNAGDLLCTLNLDDSKHLITDVYHVTYLNDYILNDKDNDKEIKKDSEYKSLEDYLIKKDMDKLMVASEFEFRDGEFTLVEPYEIDIKDIKEDETYYFILDNNREMYKIVSVDLEYINTIKYIGFIESINGVIRYEENLEYYGANPNNYICFYEKDNECELYRVIGLFKDNGKYNVKIIRNDYLGIEKYSLSDNNLFVNDNGSNIYNYLSEYYEKLSDKAKEQTIEYEYRIDYNNEESKLIDIYKYDSKNNYKLNVGLLSLTDYLYASNCNTKELEEYDMECDKNNWLYKYDNEMLINRLDTDNVNIFMVGDKRTTRYDTELNVRPTLYLDSDVMLIKGDGTINNPFIIR